MPKAFLRNTCFVAALLLWSLPGFCSEWGSATGYFAKEVQWLADNCEKESRDDFIRRSGIAFADSKPLEVGDVETFNTVNFVKNMRLKTRAQLKKIGKHCYVFLEEGKKVDASKISRIVSEFDNKIYPTTRSMFGSEWNPGIDGDSRIVLLLMDIQDGYNPQRGRNSFTAGYFYAGDCYNRKKNANSNEREMLYLDIYPSEPGSEKFLSVLAHEFQHMIHWNHDPKEFSWVNESLSQLAPFLCGYGHPPQVSAFMRNFDNNMVAWANDDTLSNYGQVYLWAYYISTKIASTEDRRKAFVRRMVAQKSQGLSGLNAAIEKQGIKNNVRNLFRGFCLANFLNDDRIERGAYGYDKHLAKMALKPDIRFDSQPFEGKGSVKCWSARAVQINPAPLKGHDIRIAFSGQKIAAGNYSNAFDVALVNYSADRKQLPIVTWLNVKDFKASEVISLGKAHDRMMLVVVNRGPETMKVEQSFARGDSPAAFSFAIRKASAAKSQPRVAASGNVRSSASSRPTRARARSIMEEIANASVIEDSAGIFLSSSDDGSRSAAEVEFDFAYQKIADNEDALIQGLRDTLMEGNYELVKEFVQFYNSVSPAKKERLVTLKNRVRDILKFEQLQGNLQAADFLSNLES